MSVQDWKEMERRKWRRVVCEPDKTWNEFGANQVNTQPTVCAMFANPDLVDFVWSPEQHALQPWTLAQQTAFLDRLGSKPKLASLRVVNNPRPDEVDAIYSQLALKLPLLATEPMFGYGGMRQEVSLATMEILYSTWACLKAVPFTHKLKLRNAPVIPSSMIPAFCKFPRSKLVVNDIVKSDCSLADWSILLDSSNQWEHVNISPDYESKVWSNGTAIEDKTVERLVTGSRAHLQDIFLHCPCRVSPSTLMLMGRLFEVVRELHNEHAYLQIGALHALRREYGPYVAPVCSDITVEPLLTFATWRGTHVQLGFGILDRLTVDDVKRLAEANHTREFDFLVTNELAQQLHALDDPLIAVITSTHYYTRFPRLEGVRRVEFADQACVVSLR
jgi:hypothetical protein